MDEYIQGCTYSLPLIDKHRGMQAGYRFTERRIDLRCTLHWLVLELDLSHNVLHCLLERKITDEEMDQILKYLRRNL